MNPKKYKLAASEYVFARIQLIDGSETLKSTHYTYNIIARNSGPFTLIVEIKGKQWKYCLESNQI